MPSSILWLTTGSFSYVNNCTILAGSSFQCERAAGLLDSLQLGTSETESKIELQLTS